jgi:hypothetical protein
MNAPAPPRPDVVYQRTGGRRIELYVPFVAKLANNKTQNVDAIDIGPVTGDHVEFFMNGLYSNSYAMLAALCGHADDRILKQMRFPDTQRVMAAFMDMVPDFIAALIQAGKIPKAGEAPVAYTPMPREEAPPQNYGLPDGVQPQPDDDEEHPGGFEGVAT